LKTYGHIVVDEVQDLTPLQLRMVGRRSLNGAMTVVGDIAQATGPNGSSVKMGASIGTSASKVGATKLPMLRRIAGD